MKKFTTIAAASVLTLAAGQAAAVPATVSVFAEVTAIPGATQTGTGSGDLTGGVLTYTLTNVIDLTYATAVIESSGTITGGSDPATGESTASSCTGSDLVCGDIVLGVSSATAFSSGTLNDSGVSTLIIDAQPPNLGVTTWTITAEDVAPPIPVPAAAWLFGSALLGLAGVRRRK